MSSLIFIIISGMLMYTAIKNGVKDGINASELIQKKEHKQI